MEQNGLREDEVLDQLVSRASEDTTFDSGLIFNTECCDPHPLAVSAYNMFMDRNMMKEQNPSVNQMEIEVIQMLSELFYAPDSSGLNGYVASGGTEANIVAFWAASRKNPGKRKILTPRHAHYSKDKIEMLLGLEAVEVPVSRDFRLDPSDVEKLVDNDTLGIFATAGTSRLGVIDPIPDLARIADKHGLHLHVDAAYGGYIIPFLDKEKYGLPDIGFEAGAHSITLDPHKFGLCPLGAGIILFSDSSYIDSIAYQADFPKIENRTLQGSRSGGPVAATWAMLKHLGIEGYERLAESLMERRDYLVQNLKDVDGIGLITEPKLSALGITYRDDDNETLLLHNYMKREGFKITPDMNPNSLRVIMHHHITKGHIDNLVQNLKEAAKSLGAYVPNSVSKVPYPIGKSLSA
jgi:tyrosine decarboxylase/aspartate 1-decarboxylase|tara:strand:+ start:19637 stop:20860 length:1224 start_codon:yes stop_codon:yes gene_type:complete